MTTKTRQVGTCQSCGGKFSLTSDSKMVLHGRHQQYGSLIGGCPGAGHAPYEVSRELIKEELKTARVTLEGYRSNLEAARQDTLPSLPHLGILSLFQAGIHRSIVRGQVSDHEWEYHRNRLVSFLTRQIPSQEKLITRLSSRVSVGEHTQEAYSEKLQKTA